MFSSRGTVRYEERGQGYRDVEKVGKHWARRSTSLVSILGRDKIHFSPHNLDWDCSRLLNEAVNYQD